MDTENLIKTPKGKIVNFIPSVAVAWGGTAAVFAEGILYVGTGGSVICTPSGVGATEVTFAKVPDGTFLPIYVKAIATGTTASDILICY